MASERMQRRLDALLDEADAAVSSGDWRTVSAKAHDILALDQANEDATALLAAAEKRLGQANPAAGTSSITNAEDLGATLPAAFVAGRYAVRRFLGEGGRKRVYLAYDTRLDREVAFCSIRTEGLDGTGRERVLREAQSMGRLGAHPNLVTIHDIGEESGAPFIVEEFMGGGDVAGFIDNAENQRPPLARTLAIAKDICRGLSFVHGGGLIHRDLKPANVFLTIDGTAKIGDFGLAVSLDRARLTQHGMMLGTVSYMPPEQALGGESTPKADLYSFGAMLYEMVTGRPPFVGDDPTAVISQHINTPPVAPSWVTEHCPPSLEEVILKLLEKDPGQRPGNAAEVLAALEKVDPSQKSASHSDSNVLERLARGVFVGREKELERLRSAFDDAFSGRGGLVMLVGEPGIGKTRATQELETYARMRGANVLWGRAHESPGAPPYWPWKQVGDSHARIVPPAELAGELDQEQIVELARIFPTLRANAQPAPLSDPESAQFRLFDAYTAFIRAGSERTPLLIVLDDLHWADKPSLLLLAHFAREVSRLRVLVVCTYRDTELSRTHPLSEALANLNREAGFLRIPLRGLTREEVDAYIRAAANVNAPARMVDRIFEETEGNPFFLSEVVNLMTQEGTLARESLSDIAVPDGVREALGRRLDRISAEANQLLQICAVVGREFTYDTLSLLDERSEDRILQLIEEAVGARVIEEMEQPGRYRFTHALMQETLLDELTTTRRVRLHGQVGEAMEKRWGARADERAPRLAEHFVEAAMLSPRFAEKAVRYAKLAAGQAEAQTAWDDAANWYERAVSLVSASEDGLGEDEAGLLVALGVCQRNDVQFRAAFRNLTRALTLYRERGDGIGAATAALETLAMPMAPDRRGPLLDEAIATLGGADAHLEARLLVLLPEFGDISGDSAAVRRVREFQDLHHEPDIEGALLGRMGKVALYQLRLEEAAALLAKAEMLGQRDPPTRLVPYLLPVMTGDVEPGVAKIHEGLDHSRETHARIIEVNLQLRLSGLALARCDFKYMERLQADMPVGGGYATALQLAARAEIEGDLEKALSKLPDVRLASGLPTWVAHLHAGRCRVRYLAGDANGAQEEFRAWAEAMAVYPSHGFEFSRFYPLTELGEALPALADDALAAATYDELQLLSGFRWDPITARGSDSIAGALGLRLGHVDAAQSRFQTGLDWAAKNNLPIEQARNLEGLAQISQVRGSAAEAMDLLDKAATLYRGHGATFYLSRVIAKKVEAQGITSEDLKSSIARVATSVQREHLDWRPQSAPDGTVTLMFSDIENSTLLNNRLGDARWMELLRSHNVVIEDQVKAHRGYVVKTLGDGYMVAFQNATDGLECAIAIQQAIAQALELGIRVRIGLHAGEVVREGDDLFGGHVNLAARVASAAGGGEIFVSGVVRELVSGQHFALDDLGGRPMKGFTQPVGVWSVRWA